MILPPLLAGPLIQSGSFTGSAYHGSCPSQQAREEVLVDVLQLLSAQFGVFPLGLTASYAAQSCDQVVEANPNSQSGMYWVDSGEGPARVSCEFI